jgi:hypothetical protein
MLPLPLAGSPIDGVLLLQLYTVPPTAPVKVMPVVVAPLHTTWFPTAVTVGVGLLVNTTSSKLGVHEPLLIVHRNVTVLPVVKFNTVVEGEFGAEIVTPGSTPNTLHVPEPTVGVLPAMVNVLVLH